MATSLQTLFARDVAAQIVVRTASTSSFLLNLFGMQPGSGTVMQNPLGRQFAYNIFDGIQTAAPMSAPLASAITVNPKVIGRVQGTTGRVFIATEMFTETLNELSFSAGQSADDAKAQYITYQNQTMGQRLANFRTAVLAGAFRNTLYKVPSGNQEFITWTAGPPGTQIDFQIPAGNLGKLAMLGAGDIIGTSWSNAGALIYEDLSEINQAFMQLWGGGLGTIVVNSVVWANVLKNTQLQSLAGSVNTIVERQERIYLNDGDGATTSRSNYLKAVLRAAPWIDWYVYDEGMQLGTPSDPTATTYTKFVDDTHALFLPRMDDPFIRNQCFGAWEGSEPISELDGQAPVMRTGMYGYMVNYANVPRTTIYGLDNFIPAFKIPKALAYGLVIY